MESPQQGEHRQYDAPAMCQSEVEGGAQQRHSTTLCLRFPVALTSTAGCGLRFAISGTCTSASTQLSSKDTASTMNRSRVYTRQCPATGRWEGKAMMAISVSASRGIAVWRPMAVIASMRFLPAFRVYQYAVYDDNGIIYQHTHCQHESGKRYTLHGFRPPCTGTERTEYGDNEADADDDSALETHGQHQDYHNDDDGLYRVDDESTQRGSHTFGLIEYLVALHACGQAAFFQLRQLSLRQRPLSRCPNRWKLR